jgi:hypothetical protein
MDSADGVLLIELSVPTDSNVGVANRKNERLYIDFPNPWPNTIITGILECGYSGDWSF